MARTFPTRESDQDVSFRTSSTNRLDHEAPMLNPIILQHVFQSCDALTLKRCRLVCTLWRDVSLDSWRQTAVLKVTEVPFLNDDLQLEEYTDQIDYSREEGDEDKLFRKPFRNYTLTGVKFFGEDDQAFQLFEGRFHSFPLGTLVTRLHLAVCGFKSNYCFTRLLSLVPNLQELSLLNNVHFDWVWEVEDPNLNRRVELLKLTKLNLCLENRGGFINFEVSWEDFFRQFPNLRALSVSYRHLLFGAYPEFNELLQAIATIREEDKTKLQIQSLDILNVEEKGIRYLPIFTINHIEALDLNLTKLKLDVGTGTSRIKLKKMLEPHSSTLESLTLFRLPSVAPFPNFANILCGHQKMSCLRRLYLNGSLVDSLGFLKWTPNLQLLRIFVDKPDYLPHKYPASFQQRRTSSRIQKDIVAKTISKYDMSGVQLTKLEILEGDFLVSSSQTFLVLTKWMPNVMSVFVPLTKDTFRVVCQRWSHSLVNLSIPKWCALDDEVITGWLPEEDGEYPGDRTLLPNVVDLQSLVVFSMETSGELPLEHGEECKHTMASLSDHSILHGFMKLPHFTHLVMYTVSPLLDSTVNALKGSRLKHCIVIQGITHCPCGRNRLVEEHESIATEECKILSYPLHHLEKLNSFCKSTVTLADTPENRLEQAWRVKSHIHEEFWDFRERAVEE